MNGHVRKRGKSWEVVLELGEQDAQRCPACMAKKGRSGGRLLWSDKGRHGFCPTCGGELQDVRRRRQILVPDARYRTKKAAQEALTRELSAGLNGVFVEPDKLTVGEYLIGHWLPSIEESVRATTLVTYRGHVTRYIVPLLGDVPLRRLTPTAINAFPRRSGRRPGGREERRGYLHPWRTPRAPQRPLRTPQR